MARILIVEDEVAQRSYLATLLRHHNYESVQAEDARSILDLVEEIRPDLILLDVVLPSLSGLAAAALIRSNPAVSRIPIIIMSGHHIGRDELNRAGVTDFVQKPFRGDVLMAAVKKALGEEFTPRERDY
jgi:DNA-binding response OmpR family regulator